MKNLIKRIPSLLNCVLIALFVSVVITGYMTIDIMAKFTTYVEVEDAARTAGFEIKLLSEGISDIELNSFDGSKLSGGCTFSVMSGSEVTAKYNLSITFPEALPEWLTVKVDGTAGVVSADGLTHKFENAAYIFEPNQTEGKEHTLTFEVLPGLHDKDMELSDLAVSIRAEQVD